MILLFNPILKPQNILVKGKEKLHFYQPCKHVGEYSATHS